MKIKYPCLSLVTDMVRPTMSGDKTNSRRAIQGVVNEENGWSFTGLYVDSKGRLKAVFYNADKDYAKEITPKLQPGQILWVRESAKVTAAGNQPGLGMCVQLQYVADGRKLDWIIWPERLTASPFLGKCIPNGIFKEAARTFVKITDVRVERLQDISTADIIAEGVKWEHPFANPEDCSEKAKRDNYFELWANLWQSIYGIESWNSNPYVWRYEFELTERPHDFLTSK